MTAFQVIGQLHFLGQALTLSLNHENLGVLGIVGIQEVCIDDSELVLAVWTHLAKLPNIWGRT